MAIIACPECGEKISDTVKQCVHCGVKIKVCPECKAVYTEDVSACSECGCVFENKKSLNSGNEIQCKNASDIVSRWEKSIGVFRHFFSKHFKHVFFAIFALILLMIVGGGADSIYDVLSIAKTLITLVVVFEILELTYTALKDYIKTVMLRYWCAGQKTDLNSTLVAALKMDFDSLDLEKAKTEIISTQWCLRVATYTKEISLRSSTMIFAVIEILSKAVGWILAGVFLSTNAEIFIIAEYFEKEVGTGGWKFSMVEDWPFAIIGIIFIVTGYLVSTYIKKMLEEANRNYVEKNLPDCYEAYQKYVPAKKMEEYLENRKYSR